MLGFEVVNMEGNRRRREVEVVRVVLHQLERHELERKRLVGEPDLGNREAARLRASLLDHADLLDPEPAAGFRVVHVQHDPSDLHERLHECGDINGADIQGRPILTRRGDNSQHDPAMDEPQPVEFLLDDYPEAIRETGMALRSLIFRTVAGTVETIRPGWRWIAYSLPEGKRVRNFAWIGPERKHIHLGFEHGTLLADPERLLHGAEERLKQFRYFTFEPSIDVDEAILADYLRRAADLATLSTASRRALALQHEPDVFDPTTVPNDWELLTSTSEPTSEA